MLNAAEIESFGVEPNSGTPLLILKEKGGIRKLAVPIGTTEAGAIAMKSLNVQTDYPLAIDLIRMVVEQMGGNFDKVVISDVSENIYKAYFQLMNGKSVYRFECRAADALALALRSAIPLFVDEIVFEKLRRTEESEKNRLKNSIRNLDTMEFGRYYME